MLRNFVSVIRHPYAKRGLSLRSAPILRKNSALTLFAVASLLHLIHP
ncbi:hypothetical protein PLUTE_a2365 [Pseudoalteromonas luteoviolacea DSM 6061]|nr:hypothetical protein [Pseudoalteromonas luteoviolacea DSM 6061]